MSSLRVTRNQNPPSHLASQVGSIHSYLLKPISRHALLDTLTSLGAHVRSILVVDDDPAMVQFITKAIRSVQLDKTEPAYRLFSALSGDEASKF